MAGPQCCQAALVVGGADHPTPKINFANHGAQAQGGSSLEAPPRLHDGQRASRVGRRQPEGVATASSTSSDSSGAYPGNALA